MFSPKPIPDYLQEFIPFGAELQFVFTSEADAQTLIARWPAVRRSIRNLSDTWAGLANFLESDWVNTYWDQQYGPVVRDQINELAGVADLLTRVDAAMSRYFREVIDQAIREGRIDPSAADDEYRGLGEPITITAIVLIILAVGAVLGLLYLIHRVTQPAVVRGQAIASSTLVAINEWKAKIQRADPNAPLPPVPSFINEEAARNNPNATTDAIKSVAMFGMLALGVYAAVKFLPAGRGT